MAEYRMILTMTTAYSVYVDAEDDEEAERLAIDSLHSGGDNVELLRDTMDVVVDWKDEE